MRVCVLLTVLVVVGVVGTARIERLLIEKHDKDVGQTGISLRFHGRTLDSIRIPSIEGEHCCCSYTSARSSTL